MVAVRAILASLMLASPALAWGPVAIDDMMAGLIATAGGGGAEDVRDGLVAEWTFDQTLTDTINGWTLAETNITGPANTLYVASPRGYAVNLETNMTRFTTTNIPAFANGAATVVFLLKLRNATGDANNNRLCKIDNAVSSITLYPYTVDSKIYSGIFRSARVDGIAPSTEITRTNWHVVAVTTATNAGVGWTFWQNTTALTNVAAQASVSIASPIVFGSHSAAGTQVFDGQFDEIRIYTRALTAEDLAGLCAFWGVCDE